MSPIKWTTNLSASIRFSRGCAVAEELRLLLDRIKDCPALAPVARSVVTFGIVRDVDVMPAGGVTALAADLVGPVDDLRIGDVGITQQVLHRRFCSGRQLALRN